MRHHMFMARTLRLAAVLLMVLSVVLLSGCAALRDKPEQTVHEFFSRMQDGEPEQAAALLADPDAVPLLRQDPDVPAEQGTAALLDLLMTGMEYDIRDVERTDTVATVEVILS